MQNMLKNKGMKPKKKNYGRNKVSNPLIHMVEVNMAIIRSKVIDEHVFKDRKPIKKKFVTD